jgi:hypothetical protein
MKSRIRLTVCAVAIATSSLLAPLNATAKNSTSLGKGVKCTWVLVKTEGGTNVYRQVCRKSGV